MGGLSGVGGDELPSLTPQWMRSGGGGGKGGSLTGGASAGGGHKAADVVPQLPPQLIRSGELGAHTAVLLSRDHQVKKPNCEVKWSSWPATDVVALVWNLARLRGCRHGSQSALCQWAARHAPVAR